jgi:lipoprotein-anchoring transpeptidase ErfK/SrfK
VQSARVSAICVAFLATLVVIAPADAAAKALPGGPTPRDAWVARIVIPTQARTAPGGGRVRTVIHASAVGDDGPVVLLVLGARSAADGVTWVRVLLPERPNGVSGWINSNLVELALTPWRIDVSLRARTVSLLRHGRAVDTWRAVVGKPSTPTPPGLYAIYERAPQPSPDDFLGTWALLLTAFSPVLHNFDGGPGEVAIHGRGGASLLDPLGTARSHGCIRIDNSAVDVLARNAAAGTPVEIR